MFDTSCKSEGFHFELGRNNIRYAQENLIEGTDKDIPYYEKYFSTFDHINFLGDGAEDRTVGPICLSLRLPEDASDAKGILRTKRV